VLCGGADGPRPDAKGRFLPNESDGPRICKGDGVRRWCLDLAPVRDPVGRRDYKLCLGIGRPTKTSLIDVESERSKDLERDLICCHVGIPIDHIKKRSKPVTNRFPQTLACSAYRIQSRAGRTPDLDGDRHQDCRSTTDAMRHLYVYIWAGPGGPARSTEKKSRPRHGTARNNLVSGRHGPIYWAGFGPRSRPMGGYEHGPFKAGTK
jgi:hypothetical protein